MIPVALFIAFMTAGAASAAPAVPAYADRGACDLLTTDEIRRVQGTPVKEEKPSEHKQQGLRFSQCAFATADFVRSVSLALITAPADKAVKSYWEDTFRPKSRRPGRKNPPRAIAATGDEAFWTGDARAGALYVLRDGAILRISIGGVADEEERVRRSQALAAAALARLAGKR